jgi:hypothetical protein
MSLKLRRLQVAEIIAQLGGPTKLARLIGVVPSAASNWLRSGRLPARTYLELAEQLHKKGLEAPPALWGMKGGGGKESERS